MRSIGWLVVLLLAAGWLASEIPLTDAPAVSQDGPDGWRRTRFGWQQRTWSTPEAPVRRPALHPAVVGLLELLLSVLALVAFPARTCRHPTGQTVLSDERCGGQETAPQLC